MASVVARLKSLIRRILPQRPNYDHIPKSLIIKHIPADSYIIDAGAHFGNDSLEFARLLPKATIYAFEPMPDIFNGLTTGTKKFPNIICEELALNDHTGHVDFYVSGGTSDASSSVLKPDLVNKYHPTVEFKKVIKVPSITLDDWLSQKKIPRIDFMWLDLQGNEINVLKQSQMVWKHLKGVHIEVNEERLYENAPVYQEVVEFLSSKGFRILKEALYPGSKIGNLLFMKNGTNG